MGKIVVYLRIVKTHREEEEGEGKERARTITRVMQGTMAWHEDRVSQYQVHGNMLLGITGCRAKSRENLTQQQRQPVQYGASGERLGWVDLDLGCSNILLGQ